MRSHRSYEMIRRRKKQIFIQKIIFLSVISIVLMGISVFISDDSVDAHTENTQSIEGEVSSECKYYTCIEVLAGDSLWSIAERYMDDNYSTIHDYMKEVKEINDLETSNIHAGQYLTVPYYNSKDH